MDITVTADVAIKLIHKQSGAETRIEQNIVNSVSTNSEEFRELVEEAKIQSFLKENVTDKTEVAKAVAKLISNNLKMEYSDKIMKIRSVVKSCYTSENVRGFIEFAGNFIRVNDFSLIGVEKFDINCKVC